MSDISAKQTLQKYWGYESFRIPQEEIINHINEDKSLVALLPTGAGKSICFQVPGLMKDGFTLVISPLIALMEDQVHQLQQRGIKAAFLHSGMKKKEIDILLDNVIYGDYKFLYVSPERIHSEFFQARMSKMNIGLIALDEAHCISQWGHDFRPAYLRILELKPFFPDTPIAAFTATATEKTLTEIQNYLDLVKPKIFKKSFEKANLGYTVVRTSNKLKECFYLLARVKGAGIIYVRSRRYTEELAEELAKEAYPVDYYHAGLSYEMRKKKQSNWINNQNAIMVSTNAFGMGIDKADVRWVMHMDIPGSLEEFYQEAGRAGRDGKQSYSMLIYDEKDEQRAWENLELNHVNHELVNEVYDKICRYLMVAMGSGYMESFEFDINDFCQKNKFSIMQVLAVISNLEKAEIFQLTESIYSPSTLMLKSSQESTFRDQDNPSEFKQFLQSLVRNFEGLFSRSVKISEEKIVRFSGLKYKKVIKYLKNIHDLGLGYYSPRTNVPKILFLTVRTEPKSLNVDYQKLNMLFESKKTKLNSVFQFIHAKSCRENVILAYFNEKRKKNCDRCDICKGSQTKDFTMTELKTLHLYLSEKLTSETDLFDLLHWWPLNKRSKVLAMLAVLENEAEIKMESNKVSIVEK